MSSWALRWILMAEAVSTVIPGAKTDEQAAANARASDLAALDPEVMEAVAGLYRADIAPLVHQRW
jgi:aryl-alcohol dehydrogenase-like predicted oxidoreductase